MRRRRRHSQATENKIEKADPSPKCQIRLSMVRQGIRIQVIAAPDTIPFAGVRIWPDTEGGKKAAEELPGGMIASTTVDVSTREDLWVELWYETDGQGKPTARVKYQYLRPFAFRVVKLSNPGKINLIGSVPRIKPPRSKRKATTSAATR